MDTAHVADRGGFADSVVAELIILRHRTATWVLLGLWALLSAVFAYIGPYVSYRNDTGPMADERLASLLPDQLVAALMLGFPFFGGTFAIMLGVLTFGSEYGWGTLKTLFTQRPGRLTIYLAKLAALAVILVGLVLASFSAGIVSSLIIASIEDASMSLPSAWMLLRGMATGWLILAVWCAFGVLLGVATRGTSLAIGIGILYTLIVEGLLSALAGQIGLLERLVEFFIRANAYSLGRTLGVDTGEMSDIGPGSFDGPFVSGTQSVTVLSVYLIIFCVIPAVLLRRRDLVG
jgi:ABC-type transport system involved in multi-copper enzyme maturation permease subunit